MHYFSVMKKVILVGSCIFNQIYFGVISFIMDMFSLEEDDGDEIFITQSSQQGSQSHNVTKNVTSSPIFGYGTDFEKPVLSLLDSNYSDI